MVSLSLMHRLADKDTSLVLLDGCFKVRLEGSVFGNMLLRQTSRATRRLHGGRGLKQYINLAGFITRSLET